MNSSKETLFCRSRRLHMKEQDIPPVKGSENGNIVKSSL